MPRSHSPERHLEHRLPHHVSLRESAIAIKDSRCKHAMFAVRNKKADSFAYYFGNARLDMLLDLLGYEDEPEAEAAQ